MPQIVIDLTAAQATRLQAAWQAQFDKPTTMANVKQHLIRELRAIVVNGEEKAAEDAMPVPAPFDPS